jgi:uncharacterized HAD superfamily protein
MKIHPGLLGFDIDGVVADTMGAFIAIARQEYGITVALNAITDFEVNTCLALDRRIIIDIFNSLLQDPLAAGLKPMPDAVIVLREFAEIAPLTFVTARESREPVAAWLSYVLGDAFNENSRLIAMGDHDGKTEHILNLGLQYFVDDRAQTCISLGELGIIPFVFDQPWNRGRHSLPVVTDWRSIRELCLPSGISAQAML